MDVDEDCDPATYGFRDADLDGSPDAWCCNADGSGGTNCGDDCDDMRPGVHPSSPEVCNTQDDDCDGAVDEGVLRTYYLDGDGDGFGVDSPDTNQRACFTPPGYADGAGDCDDSLRSVHPGATDACDAAMADEDCSGFPNDPPEGCSCTGTESRPCVASGVCMGGIESCSGGMWGSCSIMPTSEVCDGRDEDCDGVVDDGTQLTCFADGDGDGYPAAGASATLLCPGSGGYGGCPTGFTTRVPMGATLDCDDGSYAASPVGTEVCNGVDDDCDGARDEMLTVVCYLDVDNDTYAAGSASATTQCADSTRTMVGLCPVGWTNRGPTASSDCDDSNPGRSPAAAEICDTIDQDCDAAIDEGVSVLCYPDPDNDTFAAMGVTTSRQCRDVSRVAVGYCPFDHTNRAPSDTEYDCAPTDAAIHPDAAEACTLPARDEDCDGLANPPSVCTCDDLTTRPCPLPGVCGATGTETCMGGRWGACSVTPVSETCDLRDEDCDGVVDDGLTVTCYPDADSDTYAAAGASAPELCPDAGRALVGGCPLGYTNRAPSGSAIDCDDTSSGVSPAATEACTDAATSIDDDCDGMVDEALRVSCYADGDADGYAPASAGPTSRCRDGSRPSVGGCPAGYTNRAPGAMSSDCNDADNTVSPGATEVCDRVDSNCSSGGGMATDEDADGDGHAPTAASCTGGFPRDDCRDDVATTYAGAPESCDRVDSNCSSGGGTSTDEDADGDGHAPRGASCTGGFARDDCLDTNPNVHPGQTTYFGTPYCTNGNAPNYCGAGSWYCNGAGVCSVCSTCAPLIPASFDYDCNGSAARQPVQTCDGHAGEWCLGAICQSGPTAAGVTCGETTSYRFCSCGPSVLTCSGSTPGVARQGCR